MQKILISVVGAVVMVTLGLISIFFVSHFNTQGKNQSTLPSEWDLGRGSIRLGRASASTASLALTPQLANQPIPTNQWWSSAIVGPWPNNLFHEPWSTKLSAAGLSMGIPRVTASSDLISAPYVGDMTLTDPSGDLRSAQVDAHDDLSVDLQLLDSNGNPAFSVRLVKGLPYEYVKYSRPLRLLSAGGGTPSLRQLPDGRHVAAISVNNQSYEAIASPAAVLAPSGDALLITPAGNGDTLVLVALPHNMPSSSLGAYEDGAKALVTGGSVSYSISGSKVTTHLSWSATGGTPLHLVMPHQAAGGAGGTALGTFLTVRGTATVVAGATLTYTQTTPTTQATLPLPQDDAFFTKAKLETYLQQAAKTLPPPASTSYNGGKELFRLANLLQIARTSGSSTARQFQDQLRSSLVNWLTYTPGEADHYFAYDAHIRGLVAVTPEFGSDTFNDHHFHYGYFLDAASILGRYDPEFVKNYGKTVDLVAADIATTSPTNGNFPRLRVYDAYDGHSWADGFGIFADGNDQESASEAANAWFGLMQWGSVSNNPALHDTGQWLYTNETASELTYNFNAPASNPLPAAFAHHQVSLLWGGKGDWATWFSATPEAKHAILMLPISGGSLYLNSGSNLRDDLAALSTETGGKPPALFADTLLMARALTDPAAAQAGFSDSLPIDNSNSLAYTYYWLAWAAQHPSKPVTTP